MRTLTLRVRLNSAQARFVRAVNEAKRRHETIYIDFEAAVRVGKTRAVLWVVRDLCLEYPGINILLSRYTQDALDTQLRPMFYAEVPQELLGAWEPREEYQEIVTPQGTSRVYLRALKSSETTSRYAKFQGLTLAVIAIVQAEEVPEDYWQHLKPRLSQPGFPHLALLDANPPGEEHWLAREFPEDGSIPGRMLVQGSVYDNAANLDRDYIEDLERQYPPGHPLRRRFIEGKRGIGYLGEPIYGKLFRRELHLTSAAMNSELPLLEAWDFGRAAVLWAQFPPGRRVYLGELMGPPGEFLETFVPRALDLRAQLFPRPLEIQSCCDPAGADRTSHGTRNTAVEVLNGLGVHPRWVVGANHPERRTAAIQQIAAHLTRLTPQGAALTVHPRCRVLADGFEAGYVRDDRVGIGLAASPALIRPKKDGTHDHLMNCAEYLELNFGGAVQRTVKQEQRDEQRRLRESQRDRDPYDRLQVGSRSRRRGGGVY